MDKNVYLIELSESDRTDFGRIAFEDQSNEQRVFSAIWALESEVANGGFCQFFESEEPLVVSFAAAALRTIGAGKCAEIVSRAVALAPVRESEEAALSALDDEFFEYPDDLTELLYRYVAANEAVFGKVPDEV